MTSYFSYQSNFHPDQDIQLYFQTIHMQNHQHYFQHQLWDEVYKLIIFRVRERLSFYEKALILPSNVYLKVTKTIF